MGSGVLRNAFRAVENDILRAAHSCSAHISRLEYFPLAHVLRILSASSRLPPERECLALAAFNAAHEESVLVKAM